MGVLPEGCCVKPEGQCSLYSDPNQVFQKGCVEALKEFINAIGLLLGAVAVVVGIIEVCTSLLLWYACPPNNFLIKKIYVTVVQC